ncbi:hypothetical protein C8A03DRAFT_45610 [Achaetomium macrosporum]|uniref:Eukaryotic translation initiation factor 6 n=1 Tax=Achaetomium macrosporum TaxID=79813 RepID=A0AAN7HAJ3_9PEZI|nr:hypothetical protein C8A03DRAFT_45610 [Achaetomium macrosporum]
MSGNRLPPLDSGTLAPGTFRAADGTVHHLSEYRLPPNASERLYTVIQQFHRDLDRLSRHLLVPTNGADPDSGRMASGGDRDWRPRPSRFTFTTDPEPLNPGEALPGTSSIWSNPPSLPPLRSFSSNRPAINTSEFGFRSSRYRPGSRRTTSEGSGSDPRDELNRNINGTNWQLRTLLNYTNHAGIMPRPAPAVSPLLHGDDVTEENPRIKRRKLDSDRVGSGFKAVRYGKYGQLEPGPLAMEIVSCDGGLYSDEHSYAPENILKNDASVYCTKGNRCNIVLKHEGGTVFTLDELVIKAPGPKFSCPVREGMVFVAMESDELLTRTAQYQIQYLPARSQRRQVVVARQEEDGSRVIRLQPRSGGAYNYGADDDDVDDIDDDDDDDEEEEEEDDDDYRTAQIPPEFTVSPSRFSVTTEFSDDDSDGDHHHPRPPPRRVSRHTPNRIGLLAFESDSSDESMSVYRHWPPQEEFERENARRRRRHRYRRTNAQANTRDMTLEEAQEASQIATQEAVRAVGGGLMAPLAHFFIDKDKNKCTIRFQPPVSARYILLKMWNPHQDPHDGPKNIDIQGVVAKGFAGPRFCPAVELA